MLNTYLQLGNKYIYIANNYTTNLKKWRVGNCPVCHVPGYLSTHNLISHIPDDPPAFKQIITMNNKYKTIKQHLFDPLFNVLNALKLLFDVFNRYRVVGYAWYENVCGQIARDMTKRTISDTPLLEISSIWSPKNFKNWFEFKN